MPALVNSNVMCNSPQEKSVVRILTFVAVLTCSLQSVASDAIVSEPDESSYNFVSHYRVSIKAPTRIVWNHLKDLGSWMYDFEMSHVSGEQGEEGEVLRLYSGQDFLTQITSAVPNKLLVIANLPSDIRGEHSTGVAVITLNEAPGETIVDLTMSRRYTWQGEGVNPMRTTRESPEFIENTRAVWGRFLERLRTLSEGT